jgi:hypothetical protein
VGEGSSVIASNNYLLLAYHQAGAPAIVWVGPNSFPRAGGGVHENTAGEQARRRANNITLPTLGEGGWEPPHLLLVYQ